MPAAELENIKVSPRIIAASVSLKYLISQQNTFSEINDELKILKNNFWMMF